MGRLGGQAAGLPFPAGPTSWDKRVRWLPPAGLSPATGGPCEPWWDRCGAAADVGEGTPARQAQV